jgi:hypothetical protein
MKSKFATLTFIIFIVALFIRIVGMGKVPPHLSNDEISIAYDAYSLLHTGRDEQPFISIVLSVHKPIKPR